MTNEEVAEALDEVGRLLEAQGANRFRVAAYRRAATTIRRLQEPVADLVRREGVEGLRELPSIGENLARMVLQMATTGRFPMLDRLRGESDPVSVFATVPGIGRKLAERIHEELGIENLEDLELASYDGRLAGLGGIGTKRLAGIRDSLAGRLGRFRYYILPEKEPPVEELLQVDEEYRTKAHDNALPKVSPQRFNPGGKAWLPVLHTRRGKRHYLALFSNTARAHELDKTKDWVVIYSDGGAGDHQYTVVTATTGPLKGRRIVRGRENESKEYYSSQLQFTDSNTGRR